MNGDVFSCYSSHYLIFYVLNFYRVVLLQSNTHAFMDTNRLAGRRR